MGIQRQLCLLSGMGDRLVPRLSFFGRPQKSRVVWESVIALTWEVASVTVKCAGFGAGLPGFMSRLHF